MRSLAPLLCACTISCGSGGGAPDGGSVVVDRTVCDAANGPFTADVDNPYLPLIVGRILVLEGLEGGTNQVHLEVEALAETAAVGGVTTRVVEERSSDAPDAQRVFYAQAPDGTVCIYGEDEDSDGILEWEADVAGTLAGVMMPPDPAVGMVFEQFHGATLIERAEITHVGEPTETPAETFADTLTVLEDGPSIKKYARGVGMIYDDGIELVSY